MNPFEKSQPQTGLRWWRRTSTPVLVLVPLGLIVGLLAVGWRARTRLDLALTQARSEAALVAARLELQVSHVEAAAAALAAAAQAGGDTVPDFQNLAAALSATRPELAALELQPGGVVTDVFPRRGNERALRFTAAKDPARRPAVNLAIQKRRTTVAAPVRLIGGEVGLEVVSPIFHRTRDGRETFWGLVTASMRLPEALRRAGLNELAAKGYNFVLITDGSPQERPLRLAQYRDVNLNRAVVQSITLGNVEFRLGLQPASGWIGTRELALELALVVLLGAMALAALNLFASSRSLQAALSQSEQSLAHETRAKEQAQSALRQAQEETAAIEAELTQARIVLREMDQLETSNRDLRARLEATTHGAQENAKEAEARIAGVETRVAAALQSATQAQAEWQIRLDAVTRSALEAQQTAAARASEADRKIAELQARLNRARQEQIESEQDANRRLQDQLGAANQAASEAKQRADARLLQAERTIAELQARLDRARQEPQPALPAVAKPNQEQPPELQAAASSPLTNTPEESRPVQAESVSRKPPHRSRNKSNAQMDLWQPTPPPDPPSTGHEVGASRRSTPIDADPGSAFPISESIPPSAEPRQSQDYEEAHVECAREGPHSPELEEEAVKSKDHRSTHPEFRKIANQIVPLLGDQDPGAKDCLRENRAIFRAAFAPEQYSEFEDLVKNNQFSAALESLRKAARRHGFSV